MTPGARAAAAIAALDRILTGEAAEKVLTAWGRASRYAGSGDRAAVRDIVYDALRCKRSFAALGGAESGRGLVLGAARAAGVEALWFDGSAHAPEPVRDEPGLPPEGLAALDCPDWLAPRLQTALGADFNATMQAMRQRAPVFLRVNLRKTDIAKAMAALAEDGITTEPHPLVNTALEVTGNARKIQNSMPYLTGLVELQDAASQAVTAAIPLIDGQRVLDLCAGGGGKALALAARADIALWAHDAHPRRMADLPARALRAGVRISITDNPDKSAPYDVVLTDVPCSGSGSWRRDPQGKWALTEEHLADLCRLQAEILHRAVTLTAPDGCIAYATCSVLRDENEDQISAFLSEHPDWQLIESQRFSPLQGGDGFGFFLVKRK